LRSTCSKSILRMPYYTWMVIIQYNILSTLGRHLFTYFRMLNCCLQVVCPFWLLWRRWRVMFNLQVRLYRNFFFQHSLSDFCKRNPCKLKKSLFIIFWSLLIVNYLISNKWIVLLKVFKYYISTIIYVLNIIVRNLINVCLYSVLKYYCTFELQLYYLNYLYTIKYTTI